MLVINSTSWVRQRWRHTSPAGVMNEERTARMGTVRSPAMPIAARAQPENRPLTGTPTTYAWCISCRTML